MAFASTETANFDSSTNSYTIYLPENAEIGKNFAKFKFNGEAGSTVSYGVEGGDATHIAINGNRGRIKLKSTISLDHESEDYGGKYGEDGLGFKVFVHYDKADGTRESHEANVRVVVTDVTEAPFIEFGADSFSFAENNKDATEVADFKVVNQDSVSFDGPVLQGADAARFSVVAGSVTGSYKIVTAHGFDFEAYELLGRDIDLKVVLNPTKDDVISADVNITLTDANEAVVYEDDAHNFSITEHSNLAQPGQAVGSVKAADIDGDDVTYTITSGNDLDWFRIDQNGVIWIKDDAAINFETLPQSNHVIGLKVSASAFHQPTGKTSVEFAEVNITIIDGDDVPTLSVSGAAGDIDENSANELVIARYTLHDEDRGSNPRIEIYGDHADLFSASAGVVSLNVTDDAVLDYEALKDSLVGGKLDVHLRVRSDNADGVPILGNAVDISPVLNDVDDAMTVKSLTLEADEFTAIGDTLLGQIEANDADADDTISFSLLDRAGNAVADNDNGRYKIGTHGEVYLKDTQSLDLDGPDGGNETLRVIVTSSGDPDDAREIIVHVKPQPVDELPLFKTKLGGDIITQLDETLGENAVIEPIKLYAEDPEGEAVEISIASQSDGNYFKVEQNEKGEYQLVMTKSPNYEALADSTLSVRLTAETAADQETSMTVNITVTDVNEAPTEMSVTPSITELAENSAGARDVGTVTLSDDALGTNQWTLSDDRFELRDTQNRLVKILVLKDGASLDYETEPDIFVDILASDPALPDAEIATARYHLSVKDIIELTVSGTQTRTIAEGSNSLGATGYKVDAGYAGAALSVDDHRFTINEDGELILLNRRKFDHEDPANPDGVVKLTVTAQDPNDASHLQTAQVTLQITDKNDERPAFTSGDTATSLLENSGANQLVYTADALADVAGDTVAYKLKKIDDWALFRIDATTGEVRLKTNPDYELKSDYSFTIQAGANGRIASQQVTLAIADVEEAPVLNISGAQTRIFEDNYTSYIDTGYRISSYDADNDGIEFKVTDSRFAIVDGKLMVKSGQRFDYETQSSVMLTVTATDDSDYALSDSQNLRINITDVDPIVRFDFNNILQNGTPTGGIYIADYDSFLSNRASQSKSYSLTNRDGTASKEFNINSLGQIRHKISDFGGSKTFDVTVVFRANEVAESVTSYLTLTVNDIDVEDPEVSATIVNNETLVRSNFIDSDGDTISYVGSDPKDTDFGTVTFANGGFTYKPDAGAMGVDKFSLNVSDGRGGTDVVEFEVTVTKPASITIPPPTIPPIGCFFSCGGGKPIALDLNFNGVVYIHDTEVWFDMNGDDIAEKTAWIAPEDGFLAYDKDEDGEISDTDEISFTGYKEGAKTDLEGLTAFDTNEDGVLDAKDVEWSKFAVWQDLNSNGVSEDGEVKSLADWNIQSLTLETAEDTSSTMKNVHVFGVGQYTLTDGKKADFHDVALAHQPNEPSAEEEAPMAPDIL